MNAGNKSLNQLSVNTRPEPLTVATGKRSNVMYQESVNGQRKMKDIHI